MRKTLCLMICMVMLFTLLPISAFATEGQELEGDVWDGTITQPTTIVQKDGVYYYEITTCEQLAYVAQTGGNWLNANYLLGSNLFFNSKPIEWDNTGNLTTLTSTLNKWTPIGSFSGRFYGNGFLIGGLFTESGSYVGLFSELSDEGVLDGITLVNSYLFGGSYIGGIVGYNDGGLIRNCKNYNSCIFSASGIAGGICGASRSTDYYGNAIESCINHGELYSKGNYVGGIVGKSSRDDIFRCLNYGNIHADGDFIGGIVGFADTYPDIFENSNCGTISGNNHIGGICGQAKGETYLTQCISNCYNVGNVNGADSVGGIIGNSQSCKVKSCYNLAIIAGTSNIGAVAGYTDSLFGKSEEHFNYYLDGSAASGCGNTIDANDAVEKKSSNQLKTKSCFDSWDFISVWSISNENNNGYPYLQWQESILSDIPVNGILISDTTLDMSQGDYYYLTATVSPVTANNPSITWSSSDSTVATVTAAGKVTAVAPGTATITATTVDGGYTATCTVTVTARQAMEYQINSITVREADGTPLQAIPASNFLTTVSVTKLTEAGNSMIFLASYTAAGQFKGLMYVSVEDLPVGATIKVTLPVDNSKNDIAELKAFAIPSFSNLQPIGNAVTFPAEPQ